MAAAFVSDQPELLFVQLQEGTVIKNLYGSSGPMTLLGNHTATPALVFDLPAPPLRVFGLQDARRLLSETVGSPAIVVRAYDGWPAADLRTLAVKLTCLGSCVALLGSRAEKAHLVFAQSPGLGHGIPGLLKDALGLVGGRGGGRGDLTLGGGDRVEQLGPALERAAATVRARSVSPRRP